MLLYSVQERRKGREAGQDQAAREADLLNEVRSLQAITRDSRRCPRCGMAISKIEGCNKMTCSQCQSYFCYRCGKGIDGYDHFRLVQMSLLLKMVLSVNI